MAYRSKVALVYLLGFALDLLTDEDGSVCGVLAWEMATGKLHRFRAHQTILATGGYGNVFYLSTNAKGSNATAIWWKAEVATGIKFSIKC